MSGDRPPILKSSIKSWNWPCTSPQTVTGHFTSWTFDSFDNISFAYNLKKTRNALASSGMKSFCEKLCIPYRRVASLDPQWAVCNPSTARPTDQVLSLNYALYHPFLSESTKSIHLNNLSTFIFKKRHILKNLHDLNKILTW